MPNKFLEEGWHSVKDGGSRVEGVGAVSVCGLYTVVASVIVFRRMRVSVSDEASKQIAPQSSQCCTNCQN